jgi:hypothetical protein
MQLIKAKVEQTVTKERKKLPNNPHTFKLFPLESFKDHPVGWIKWMTRTNYQVTDSNLKAALKAYFKKRESKYSKI